MDFLSIFSISLPAIIALATAVLSAVTALLLFMPMMFRLMREARKEEAMPPSKPVSLSVVAYAFNGTEGLEDYISTILSQSYPDFELIVVCSSTGTAAADIADYYHKKYPRVGLTFIPPESKNVSRRKLAFTIGIKRAKGDVVLTTTTACLPDSETWLEEMMAPFADPEKQIVLGITKFDYENMPLLKRTYRRFRDLVDIASRTSAALQGKAYRGDGDNMAFRRELFFANKGYARTITLQFGDDDIFLREIATRANVAVAVNYAARLHTHWEKSATRIWSERHEHYLFTRHWLPAAPFLRTSMASASSLVACAATATAIAVSPAAITTWGSAVIILLLLWSGQIIAAAKASAAAAWKAPTALTPLYMIWLCIGDIIFALRTRHRRRTCFTY